VVCSRDDERIELNAWDRYKVVNGLPPADRWPNRKDESRLRTIFKDVHRSSIRAMARLVSDSGVCI